MKTTYIYGAWDLTIQKFVYIGKSNNAPARFKGHMKCSSNVKLRKLVEEKGANSFRLIILEKTSFFELRDWIKREKFWIKKFKREGHPLCNKNDGGGGVTEVSEETRAKMSNGAEESWTPERRKEQSERWSGENNPLYGCIGKDHPRYGMTHTEEVKAKLRESQLGEKNSNYGRYYTEEERAKKSEAMSGVNHPNYGKHPYSEETIRKMSDAHAKPYPAFFNISINKYIPAGINLSRMCEEHTLRRYIFQHLMDKKTKMSRDGWRLATALEIIDYGNESVGEFDRGEIKCLIFSCT